MRSTTFLLIAALSVVGSVAGHSSDSVAPATVDETESVHLQAFDQVWTTVRDTHWDPELGGVDWDAVRDRLEPKMRAATEASEARAVLQEMIETLGQSHFQIIPGDVYEALATSDESTADEMLGDGVTGVEVRPIEGAAVVTSVRPGSSAAVAGLMPGWIIDSVSGEELAPVLRRVGEHVGDDVSREFVLTMALLARLQGEVGEVLQVVVRDGSDHSRQLELELEAPPGRKVQLGYLPPMHVWLEHHEVADGRVGYIAFNAFFDPASIMPEFERAIRSFDDVDGLIIDVRGNPGGIGAMAMGMAGWLVQESGQKLGKMTTRSGSINFVVFPRPAAFSGPVAVLVDGTSASTAEIFAGGLQDLGRGLVFGRRTSGQALPSRVDRLANGDAFQHAFASYESAAGYSLEGRGVIPDVVVAPTREELLTDPDPVLSAAVSWIESEKMEVARDSAAAQ